MTDQDGRICWGNVGGVGRPLRARRRRPLRVPGHVRIWTIRASTVRHGCRAGGGIAALDARFESGLDGRRSTRHAGRPRRRCPAVQAEVAWSLDTAAPALARDPTAASVVDADATTPMRDARPLDAGDRRPGRRQRRRRPTRRQLPHRRQRRTRRTSTATASGDACDPAPRGPDGDGDGVPALDDRCPTRPGPAQRLPDAGPRTRRPSTHAGRRRRRPLPSRRAVVVGAGRRRTAATLTAGVAPRRCGSRSPDRARRR